VIPILVGLVIVALGVHRIQRHRVPSGAARQPGIVVDVQETQALKNPRRTLRRPVVEVDHPGIGRRIEVEPDEYDNGTYQVGDVMDVAYLPDGDRFVLVPDRPVRQLLGLPAAGVALIGFQIADWLS
jgi:hypothetical protein